MKRHLVERELTPEGPRHRPAGPGGLARSRSVTVNLAESPLAWLHVRTTNGHSFPPISPCVGTRCG